MIHLTVFFEKLKITDVSFQDLFFSPSHPCSFIPEFFLSVYITFYLVPSVQEINHFLSWACSLFDLNVCASLWPQQSSIKFDLNSLIHLVEL